MSFINQRILGYLTAKPPVNFTVGIKSWTECTIIRKLWISSKIKEANMSFSKISGLGSFIVSFSIHIHLELVYPLQRENGSKRNCFFQFRFTITLVETHKPRLILVPIQMKRISCKESRNSRFESRVILLIFESWHQTRIFVILLIWNDIVSWPYFSKNQPLNRIKTCECYNL